MYLSLAKVGWFKTEASVVLCLLLTMINRTASQGQSITSATLTASMTNSHNATIRFDGSTFKSFHDCLCGVNTWRCRSDINYIKPPPYYTYKAEVAETFNITETSDQNNYSEVFVCTIPGFYHLLDIKSSSIICTRLNESCKNSNEDYPTWSVNIDSYNAELKWVDQTIESFSSTPDNVVGDNNKKCTNANKNCDLSCLRQTAMKEVVVPTPAVKNGTTTETSPGADGLSDNSGTPVGTIVGVVFAVLIVIALVAIGIFFWKRRSRIRKNSTSVTNEHSPAAFGSNHLNAQAMRNGLKQEKHVKVTPTDTGRAEGTIGTYETIRDHENINASIYNEVSATDSDNNPNGGLSNVASASGKNNDKNLVSSSDDYSQYTSIDDTGLQINEYNRLGDEPTVLAHPYNVLLSPKEDPTRRNPIAVPDNSKLEPSQYSLAQPIVGGASGQGIHPTEVIDITQSIRDTSGNGAVNSRDNKSANDYDYPSDEDASKRADQPYFELEKEENGAEVYTSSRGGNDQPYFELEKEDDVADD